MSDFSLKFDDKTHSLNAENGISIDLIGDLLKSLYEAIDNGEKEKCTLSEIRGNCYKLEFITNSDIQKNNFLRLHKNIEELPYDSLSPTEQAYTKKLGRIISLGYYLNAYSGSEKIAHITEINKSSKPKHYYAFRSVHGYITQHGSKKLASKDKHIIIDGYPGKIKVTPEEDLEFKNYYATQKLKFEIKVKVSLDTRNEFDAELISYRKVGDGNFVERILESNINLNKLDETKSFDDLVNIAYGKKD